jgi:DNA-binding transcriptional LysR family regulator
MLAIENIHDLEIARAVSEQGSFTAAARTLGITQPAVSQAVARLERQLGATFFNRQESGHEAFLTDAGAVLLAHAITALDELQGAVEDLEVLRGDRPITVGMPSAIARHYFPQGLGSLTAAQHDRPVEIVLHDSERLREELRLRHVDVGMLASADLGISLPHATFSKVASHPLTLAVRQGDRPAGGTLSILELARHHVPIIAYAGDRFLRAALERWLAPMDAQLNVVAESDQLDMFYQLVLAGMGVGVSSGLVLERSPEGICLLGASDEDLPVLNVFVFEDVVRAHGPERLALGPIRRQLFAAAREGGGA